MARILRAPLARNDLLDIWATIADGSSAATADSFLVRIYGALDRLSQSPYIGRERAEFAGSPRSIVVRPYVIFYEPLAEGGGIAVWRVIHGARTLEPLVERPGRFD
jgi:plasmid stabilization system protein ParE